MKVQLLLLLALVGPFTRASPTGLYSTATGADVTSQPTETEKGDITGPFRTTPEIATDAVDKTTTSTRVTTEGTRLEAETITEAWTTSSYPTTSAPHANISTPTEETTTIVLSTAEETTTATVAAAEETTSPVATLPEETTTYVPEPIGRTVDEGLIAVTENYSTGEEVNIEESTEGEEGLSSGQIVGIVIGAILAVVIVIAVVFAFVRRMGKYSP